MASVLLVGTNPEIFRELADVLSGRPEIELIYAKTGAEALALARKNKFALAVTDEGLEDMSGLNFVHDLLMVNAMTGTAVISGLSHDDFHEASEGLGVLFQFSPNITRQQAEALWERFEAINRLSAIVPPESRNG